MKRGQRAAGGDFEDRAGAVGPASGGRPVEVPVAGLDQRGVRVTAVSCPGKLCSSQRAAGGDFEDGAIVAIGPAAAGCPVEVPVGGLDQPG